MGSADSWRGLNRFGDPHFAPMTNGQKRVARVRLLSAVGANGKRNMPAWMMCSIPNRSRRYGPM
jgi:hypothetical protein